MHEWRSYSFYEYGETVSLKGSIYFCLSSKTNAYPLEISDWVKVDQVCEKLPKGKCGDVVYLSSSSKCFVFVTEWKELNPKESLGIIYSNRDPLKEDGGKFWINEVSSLIFKKSTDWKQVNDGDEEIFEFSTSPTQLDDENDSSGNGVFTEGDFWIDYRHNKVYVNVDPTYKKSIWTEI